MKRGSCINWRRVAGAMLLLCAALAFGTNAYCTLWFDCACTHDGDEILMRPAMVFDSFTMMGFWLGIPMDIQFVIPSLWTGQRMMMQSWQSIKWWIFYPSMIVAMTGLSTCAYWNHKMIEVMSRICECGVVRDTTMYGNDNYTYIILGFLIFNLIMLIPWTRDIIRRPSKSKEVRDSLVTFGAFMFGICQIFYIWGVGVMVWLD